MKKTTIYVLAKNSMFWNDEHDATFDLIVESTKCCFNDRLLANGWVDSNTVLSALGLPKELDKVALGWKIDSTLDFKNYAINIVTKDDGVCLAFDNVVNLLEDGESNEN